MGDWMFFAGLAAVVILLITPLREAAWWLMQAAFSPLFDVSKTAVHYIFRAHVNILRNASPRTRIYYELSRRRTSHTEEQ